MKKKKLFEVSLINKAYSRIIQNTTRFYTSDTALEIGFDIVEMEYTFDSAVIILLNENDRSLVTRELARSSKGFTYELESDIIEHYGNWAAQLKLEKDGEVYISSPVGFSIENDLYNSRPPKLSEVNTWKNLRKIADGLISDIRSELETVAVKSSEIEGAESERQQAETQRASAESSRVSAEAQRKTDHTNRSVELAGKADKVVLKNLVENGDFSNGTTGWTATNAIEIDNNTIHVKSDNPASHAIWQDIASVGSNDKFYVTLDFNLISNPENKSVFTSIRDYGTVTSILQLLVNLQIMNQYQTISTIVSSPNGIRLTPVYVTNPGYEARVTNILVFNLTTVFGAGNEPTKEEMDRLIEITGYIDGEYALNNKEMLGHLMKGLSEKANKKQEDWITPTLLNGSTGTIQFRKNEFGRVEFRGVATHKDGTLLMILPTGYRPLVDISVIGAVEASVPYKRVQIYSNGNIYFAQPYATLTTVDIWGVSFPTGRDD